MNGKAATITSPAKNHGRTNAKHLAVTFFAAGRSFLSKIILSAGYAVV